MDDVLEQMRAEWNQRAAEDANYYVAFGRRDQDDDEFFATSADVVRALEFELKRFERPPRRALEIGCGPGRLLRPLSRHFEEIHGADVSDEMIRLARGRLAATPNAHVHRSSGSDLAGFEDSSIDFVYSYAVFQHIPSREVVLQYLTEARRVLCPGGILRCQINGLPQDGKRYTTWEGVRIAASEILQFADDNGLDLLALEGEGTQYMWTTLRKPAAIPEPLPGAPCRIYAITDSFTGEPAVPARGRFASASIRVENLPRTCNLNRLTVLFDGVPGSPSYLGWPQSAQLNVGLPSGIRTGLVPVEVRWRDEPLCAVAHARIISPGPMVPRLVSIADGVNLLSGPRIVSGSVKAVLEEVPQPDDLDAAVGGRPIRDLEYFLTDALARRFEVNFRLPEGLSRGPAKVEMRLGHRRFAPIPIEVA
ncbi:MAG: methyltransferase domain-containing protein [Bryobacteraceae bacterium]